MNTKFQILREGCIKLVIVLFVLSNFQEHFNALLDQVFPNGFQDLVLLQQCSINVERKILSIHNTPNKEFDFARQLPSVKEIKRCPQGDKEDNHKL